MIRPDAEVIRHTSPYRPIGRPAPAPEPDIMDAVLNLCDKVQRAAQIIEGERIWSLVRQSCGDEVQE